MISFKKFKNNKLLSTWFQLSFHNQSFKPSLIVWIFLHFGGSTKIFYVCVWWMVQLFHRKLKGMSWSWSYAITESVPITTKGVLDTILCDKVCQWLVTGSWFSPGTQVSSTNKNVCHDKTEILLKVALNTINLNLHSKFN